MKRIIQSLFILMLFQGATLVLAQDTHSESVIQLKTPYSYRMIKHNQDLRKVNILLDERKDVALSNGSLVFRHLSYRHC
jgi:hypothetical protein